MLPKSKVVSLYQLTIDFSATNVAFGATTATLRLFLRTLHHLGPLLLRAVLPHLAVLVVVVVAAESSDNVKR